MPVFVHSARDKVGAGLSARINALGMIVVIDGSASMVCTRRWCALTRQMPSLISRGNCVVLAPVGVLAGRAFAFFITVMFIRRHAVGCREDSREADLSTQQVGAQAPARLPDANGHHGRPTGA